MGEILHMKFEVKKVTLGDSGDITVFIPINIPNQLSVVKPVRRTTCIIGNSVAFEFLKKIFYIVANIKEKGFIFIPTKPLLENDFKKYYDVETFDMDIVLVNYHSLHIKPKDIKRVISICEKVKGDIRQICTENLEIKKAPNFWLTGRKLTTRKQGKTFIISTNRNVYFKFVFDLDCFIGYEDDEEYNFYDHIHEDYRIGTSMSDGFDFVYHYKENNK